MSRPQILPNSDELLALSKQGLTHQEIATRITDTTGYQVTRSAVSVALHRAGLVDPKERYQDEIPWSLSGKDLKSYPVRMLRLLARQRRGLSLTVEEAHRLQSWLLKMEENKAVVAFDPDQNPSIFYVMRRPEDDPELPIRKERVHVNPQK